LKNMKVVAIDTLKFIDVKDAIYVVGSDKSGTMSGLSKYAFEGRMSARRFAKENEGRIMKFDKAYEYALKDF
ncbi:MAG: nitrous oxide reductase accessory protein NosL, partial [Sulfurovaceae bacterium]|nr:nitrous oxide reductase accessory protein NosL [Sulfurovaceae bacterium]